MPETPKKQFYVNSKGPDGKTKEEFRACGQNCTGWSGCQSQMAIILTALGFTPEQLGINKVKTMLKKPEGPNDSIMQHLERWMCAFDRAMEENKMLKAERDENKKKQFKSGLPNPPLHNSNSSGQKRNGNGRKVRKKKVIIK